MEPDLVDRGADHDPYQALTRPSQRCYALAPPVATLLHSRDETITATDVGLPPGTPLPWTLLPAQRPSPLVISFPHVGLQWPREVEPYPSADFARNADFEVDHLYDDAARLGAVGVRAVYSRLLVDLNRAADDISPAIVPDHPAPRPRRRPGLPSAADDALELDPHRPGRGVVWTHAIGDVRLRTGPLPYRELADRIDRFHEPYCRALELLLQRRRERFGYAILLDAHSMPGCVGVDLVLGTLAGASCAPQLERLALRALGDRAGAPRLRVRLNDPYLGGELVRRFGRPAEGLHAFQLEVSRSLYMDERTLALWSPARSEIGPASGPARTTTAPAALHEPRHDAGPEPGPEPGPKPGHHTGHDPGFGRPAPGQRPGGPRPTPRAHPQGAHARTHPRNQPPQDPGPTPRQKADFAELRQRVSCLVRVLSDAAAVHAAIGARTPSLFFSGTFSDAARATHASSHSKLRARS